MQKVTTINLKSEITLLPPTLFSGTDIPIILLAKMQHYGIPTRLIDLTSNALVALYFACSGNQDRDGEVLAFSADVCSAYNPYVNAIADTYRLTNNSIMDVQTYYHRVKQQGYFSNATYPDSSDKTNLCLDSFLQMASKPIFVETGNICERQKMQSGYFLLFPNRVMKKKEITNTIIENDKVQKHVVKRIIVPAEYKKEILEGLRILGISEETLFSDNPDIVMRNITRNLRSRYH